MYWNHLGGHRVPGDGQTKRNPSGRLLGVEIEVVIPGVNESEDGDDLSPCQDGDDLEDGDDGFFALRDNPEMRHSWSKLWACREKLGLQIVADGSLPSDGREIVMPPAGGDLYLDAIAHVCRALRADAAKVTRACGLHVHADARDLSAVQLYKLALLWIACESAFVALSGSRCENSFCRPVAEQWTHKLLALTRRTFPHDESWCQRAVGGDGELRTGVRRYSKRYLRPRGLINHLLYGTADTRQRPSNKYAGCRYSAMNLHSEAIRGTVELRIPPGTTQVGNIQNWGMIWASFVDFAARATWREVESVFGHIPGTYDNASLGRLQRVCESLPSTVWAWAERRWQSRSNHSAPHPVMWHAAFRPAA